MRMPWEGQGTIASGMPDAKPPAAGLVRYSTRRRSSPHSSLHGTGAGLRMGRPKGAHGRTGLRVVERIQSHSNTFTGTDGVRANACEIVERHRGCWRGSGGREHPARAISTGGDEGTRETAVAPERRGDAESLRGSGKGAAGGRASAVRERRRKVGDGPSGCRGALPQTGTRRSSALFPRHSPGTDRELLHASCSDRIWCACRHGLGGAGPRPG